MNSGVVELEREIKDVLRRAKSSPDKDGSIRRETLNRLIELIHSSHPTLKIIAAGNIRFFFSDFPDLQETAINAVYDLCEDHSPRVRMEGYEAITQVSRVEPKWVKRNADVLLQLLQSDEPDEVVIVKKALTEHLDMNPRITLGVLCDQIVPPDEPMDQEEISMRERLRSLVLSFLAGEAKRAIVERHAVAGTPSEDVLVQGLLKAIEYLGHTDTEMVVKDLLLSLPSYSLGSTRGPELLTNLLGKAKHTLRTDLQRTPPALIDTRFYLELASFVTLHQKVAPSSDLLEFYCTSLIQKMILQKLPTPERITAIIGMAKALEGSSKQTEDIRSQALQRQVVDASPFLFQNLAQDKAVLAETRAACSTLLRACLRRKETGWFVPANVISAIHEVGDQSQYREEDDQSREIQKLIRSLAPLVKPQATPPTLTVQPGNSKNADIALAQQPSEPPRRKMVPHRRPDQAGNLPSDPVASSSKRDNGVTSPQEDSSRPHKKPKLNDHTPSSSAGPSLLSRMDNTSSNQASSSRAGPSTKHSQGSSQPTPLPSKQGRSTNSNSRSLAMDPESTPPGGWSIKGAASAKINNGAREAPRSRSGSVVSSSAVGQPLLTRIQHSGNGSATAAEYGGGGGGGVGRGRGRGYHPNQQSYSRRS